MNIQLLDYAQRRLYQIDREVEAIRKSIDMPGSRYGDPRWGYRLAYDDIDRLEKEADELINQLKSNI